MNKPLILVIEDEPSMKKLITGALKHECYRFSTAPNGATAIMEMTSHNPGLQVWWLELGAGWPSRHPL